MSEEWILFANNDLITAKHIYENMYPKQVYISSYLSHQCAEKSLKAILVFHDCEPPKIHNLSKLCEMCSEYDETFSEIFELCTRINQFGVESRYPNNVEIDDKTAEIVIVKAQKIYNFCKAKIA
jgi:HEPN domain-containing protein